jgi:hypothetical protein
MLDVHDRRDHDDSLMIAAIVGPPPRLPRVEVGVPASVRDGGIAPRVRHLPVELAVAGGLLVASALVGFLVGGPVAAVGAGAGVLLVTLSYTASTLAIAWADSVNPRMVLAVGMAMYITKFSLLGAVLIFVSGTDWAGQIPMALGIVAGIVTWIGIQIWWTVRHEHPYVDPD